MKLFIITGQTATGKTDYAVQLAKKYDGELINCDSRQIYKGLDIITGKDIDKHSKFKKISSLGNFDIGYYPIAKWSYSHMVKNHNKIAIKPYNHFIPLWLYDIVDPKTYFSSYDYITYATKVLQNILARGKTPIIVGGTYFYLYHFLYEVETEHIGPDWKLRNEFNKKSVIELQKIFQELSLRSYKRLNNSDKNNPQRLIRKIEILTHNKNSKIDSFQIPPTISLAKKLHKSIQIKYIGFRYKDAHVLKKIIKKRVEKRIENGAIEEVKMLLKHGYSEIDPGLKTIGYSQIIKYIKGQISIEKAVEQWITKEVQYAKRQYTFMKKDHHIQWRLCNI